MCNFEKELKICAVIVTYGDRFHLLKQVMDACFKEGINKIIVVDNGSEENSRNQLKKYEEKDKDRLKVIYLDENTGSAGGYKRGLQEAYNCKDCEYILTLDDDNVIPKNSLNKLQSLLRYLDNYKYNLMLGMYRPVWDWDKKSIEEGWIKGYKSNNFIGLNFLTFIKKFFSKKVLNFQKNKYINLFPLQPVEVTSLGGLFFSKKIIDKIGYPNEDFFVYADDHEYTYRLTRNGGKIFLCSEIPIKDIDQTYKNGSGSIGFFHRDFPEIKMYYTIRNYTYFSKRFITNKFFFYGNLIAVSLLHFKNIFKTPLALFIRRYKLYLKAVKDGLNNRLGKTF